MSVIGVNEITDCNSPQTRIICKKELNQNGFVEKRPKSLA